MHVSDVVIIDLVINIKSLSRLNILDSVNAARPCTLYLVMIEPLIRPRNG